MPFLYSVLQLISNSPNASFYPQCYYIRTSRHYELWQSRSRTGDKLTAPRRVGCGPLVLHRCDGSVVCAQFLHKTVSDYCGKIAIRYRYSVSIEFPTGRYLPHSFLNNVTHESNKVTGERAPKVFGPQRLTASTWEQQPSLWVF